MYLRGALAPADNYVYSRSVRPLARPPAHRHRRPWTPAKKSLRVYRYKCACMCARVRKCVRRVRQVGRVIPFFLRPFTSFSLSSSTLITFFLIRTALFLLPPDSPPSFYPPDARSLSLSLSPSLRLCLFLVFCFSFLYSLSPLTAVILPDTTPLYTRTHTHTQ